MRQAQFKNYARDRKGVLRDDKVTMDRALYDQLLSMLESLSDIQGRTALNEAHITELNNDLSLLRKGLGL
jgi:hypothetical protein